MSIIRRKHRKFSLPLKENHIALWTWLAKHPEKTKDEWPGWETIESLGYGCPEIESLCFAYELCNRSCPVVFGDGIRHHCVDNAKSFYRKWLDADNPKDRTKYALLIANGWR